MLVKFRTNLGIGDATKCGVAWQQCTRDSEVEVSDAKTIPVNGVNMSPAEWLVAKRFAEPVDRKVKAVAKQPEMTAPSK